MPHPLFAVDRLPGNPIIRRGTPGLADRDADNINGPSLIRVPDWIPNPLGRYYLYFAHHKGEHLRLAYADDLGGPWRVHPPGVLHVADGPGCEHIASPDVHVDPDRRQIRLYFHQPVPPALGQGQKSFVALSSDGLHFTARPEVLGDFYFRVFQYDGWHYALAKRGNVDGVISRSADGLTGFVEGPHFLPGVRHTAVWRDGHILRVVYTLVGEPGVPERLYLGQINLLADWRTWTVTDAHVLLEPELDWEGADCPLAPSGYGAVRGRVRQLRDPAVFEEGGRRWLLYSVAGEQGLAIAALRPRAARGSV